MIFLFKEEFVAGVCICKGGKKQQLNENNLFV